MQAIYALRRNTQYQPSARMIRSDLHRNHPLLGAHRHSGNHARRPTSCHTTGTLTLLYTPHKPRKHCYGPHKEHHNHQCLGHAPTIHG
jgi:hypothetical protein